MKLEKVLSSPATWYVFGGIIVVLALRNWGVLPKGKTNAEKIIEQRRDEVLNNGSIWSYDFWTKYPAKNLTQSVAEELAERIDDAFGYFDDDEAEIEGVFRSLKYQTQVSQIAYYYNKEYKRDLHSDLIDTLSQDEMGAVYDIISSKPL